MRLLATALLLFTLPSQAAEPTSWTQWRGPLGTGASPDATPPLQISEHEGVSWKIALPGEGSASPVVHGDRVFVSTAVPGDGGEYAFTLMAIDANDGTTRWSRAATTAKPHEGRHQTNTYASFSPMVDDARVYAYFGSRGLFAFSHDGEPLWSVDLGDMATRREFGEGSSPALLGDTIVVVWDHEGDSFVVALDAATGNERWRQGRDEPSTWSTPLLLDTGAGVQVITAGTRRVRSYDMADGELLWEGPGLTLNVIPSPVAADGVVYLTSGFQGTKLMAVDLGSASGMIDDSEAIVWRYDSDTPYVPSSLLYEGGLYILKSNSNVLTRLNAATGAVEFGPERLPGLATIYASPAGAAGRVYVFDRDGNALVLKAGPEFEVLHQGQFEDGFDASPAMVGNDMYLRGHRSLYRLSAE